MTLESGEAFSNSGSISSVIVYVPSTFIAKFNSNLIEQNNIRIQNQDKMLKKDN